LFCGCASESPGGRDNDADAAALLVLEEDLRIGSVADPDLGFSAVYQVDVDRDGQIYAFEAQDVEIRVFSPEGRLLRRIGRQGEGPGEFDRLERFGVAGDTIWVLDGGLRRLTLFSRDGTVLDTKPSPEVLVPLHRNQTGHVRPAVMREDGLFASDMRMFSGRRGVTTAVEAGDTVQVPRVLFSLAGEIVDTVGFEPRPAPEPSSREWIQFGSQRYSKPRPPSDRPLSVTTGDGRIWVDRAIATTADAAVFSVTRLDFAADTIYSRQLRYQPARYSETFLDTIAWRSARIPGGGYRIVGGTPQIPPLNPDSLDLFRVIRASLEFPEFQPPVQSHYLSDDGQLWLGREDNGGANHRWLLLDENGQIRGQTELPRRAYIGWHRGDTFIAIELDDDDVPWLVRYRIRNDSQ
jgi:hypothetical protein